MNVLTKVKCSNCDPLDNSLFHHSVRTLLPRSHYLHSTFVTSFSLAHAWGNVYVGYQSTPTFDFKLAVNESVTQ